MVSTGRAEKYGRLTKPRKRYSVKGLGGKRKEKRLSKNLADASRRKKRKRTVSHQWQPICEEREITRSERT